MAVTDSPGAGRVLIASGGPLEPEPSWTRYDDIDDCRCYGFDSFAGRQSELDTTDTGHATVYFHDRSKTITEDLVGLQIMLQLYNPVTASWVPRWRGHIDDVGADLVDIITMPLANTALSCVGIFDYLGGCKMIPGTFGDPGGPTTDVVFYEDGRVDDRITALLTDAQLDPDMFIVFTGNVDVNETLYDPDDVILQALRDAADAEFPGVANVYEDRVGRVVFHGRHARFDPETTAGTGNWDFVRWAAATRSDVSGGVAQIREFSWNSPRDRIINSYLAYPREDETGAPFDRADITTLQQTDGGSIASYGYRGKDAPDLIIKDNFNNSNTGADECELFGDFYVTNYAQPRKAIRNVVFKSIRVGDARAAAAWDLMCRADISDAIDVTVDEAQIADESYFIDGISVECRALNPDMDVVTVTPNLTPASYYGTDVFA
jgi:hypothetical protein